MPSAPTKPGGVMKRFESNAEAPGDPFAPASDVPYRQQMLDEKPFQLGGVGGTRNGPDLQAISFYETAERMMDGTEWTFQSILAHPNIQGLAIPDREIDNRTTETQDIRTTEVNTGASD